MKNIFVSFCATAMIAFTTFQVHAQSLTSTSPRTISYQGFLLDAAKKPLTGNHKIAITLYDAEVEGNTVHTENYTTAVTDGVFSILLGSNEPLESSMRFDKPYWLGISIDGGAELLPRTALSSVPYSIHADVAGSLAKGASGAVTTLNGRSGDISIKGGDGTMVKAEGNTITITAIPITSLGDATTQATTVNSITGTANQILANGTSGTQKSGDITLTLPQNINTAATPTFNGITLTSMGTAGVVHNNVSGVLTSALVSNADVANNAAIAYSKLNVAGSITNSDVANGANIAANKLNLTNGITSGDIAAGTIMNSDINAAAGIAASKLNLTNAIVSGDIVSGTIMNSDINAGAAIVASKLNLANAITSGDIAAGTIVNSDINANAAIAYSKLNLGGNIVDADISGGANIAYNKLNLTGNIANGDIAANANIAASKLNLANAITSGDIAAGAIVNSDVNAAAAIAYGKLNLSNSIVNGDIAGGAAISDTKLATISTGGKVANSATTATSANTNNAIVARDGSGNFSAGTITAALTGNATNVTGTINEAHGGTNTTAYTKGDILYASASNTLSKRVIGATGQVLTISGGVPVWSALSGVGVTSMTGTANQVLVNGGSGSQTTGGITLTLPQNIHSAASPTFAGLTLSGLNTTGIVHNTSGGALSTSLITDADIAANAAIADTKLATIATVGKVANTATTATATNTNNAIVARDGTGGFSAGDINAATLNLTGEATSALTQDVDPPNTLATKSYVDDIAVEYWSIGGNTGVDPVNNYFGTNDATDLQFRTNSVEGMRLTNGGSLLLSGTSGVVPTSGAGTRLMWIPSLGAFRAGKANDVEWDASSIGAQSVAMGTGTLASGAQSVAMGFFSSAYGTGSAAIGSGVSAYVDGATAFGSATQAAGFNSVAMGENSTAWADGSVAIGSNTNSRGLYSLSMGSYADAVGDYSVALGDHTSAGFYDINTSARVGGDYSVALGRAITTGSSTFAYNSGSNSLAIDISAMSGVAYFGDADLIIGNDDNMPRALKFYGPNNMGDLSGSFFTSFAAQTQSDNITYTLPASQGSANSLMMNDGAGGLSWSSLSSLNIPTGSGNANQVALWNSSSSIGSASNLYYTSNSLGIGVSNPSQALDVSGNANVSGSVTSGGGITTNGIAMTGGTTVLSYNDVSISGDGSITIPNVSVVNIQDDGANKSNAVAMPSGTNGQIIYIYNNDAQPTSGDVTISANAMGVFVYIGGWKKAN